MPVNARLSGSFPRSCGGGWDGGIFACIAPIPTPIFMGEGVAPNYGHANFQRIESASLNDTQSLNVGTFFCIPAIMASCISDDISIAAFQVAM